VATFTRNPKSKAPNYKQIQSTRHKSPKPKGFEFGEFEF
jgi:hypothetical protein